MGCKIPRCERPLYHSGWCEVHLVWKYRKTRVTNRCQTVGCILPRKAGRHRHCGFHEQQHIGRPKGWPDEALEYARMLLEDGCSYREASRSSGVPRTTLRERLPGYGWSLSESGTLGASIAGNDKLLRLQREIGLFQNGD